jgi:Kef-type K+ transport system membrane component KefB
MLTAVLVILAVVAAWGVAAVAFAFLAGSIIHERDHHDAVRGSRRRTTLVVGPRPR